MSDFQALSILMKSPVTQEMIQYTVNSTLKVIKCKRSPVLPTPPSSPSTKITHQLPSLMTFISKLVRYSNVQTGTLLSTLVFLDRLQTKLPKHSQGKPCTLHRIFLACLIISSKFNNDSSPKNSHWASFTDGLFDVNDITLMERQLLNLLNWDVRVTNYDLSHCLKRFIDPIKCDLRCAQKMRRSLPKSSSGLFFSRHSSRPPQQSPPLSPEPYGELKHSTLHSRSSSISSTSSLSSIGSELGQPAPVYLYHPDIQKTTQPEYNYSFDNRELCASLSYV